MTEQTPAEVLEEVPEVIETTETVEGAETETQAEETQETPEAPQEESEEAKEKARNAYEARQAKKSALKQENEHLRKQLEQVQAQAVPAQQATPPVQQKYRDPNAPSMENYDTVEEYLDARDHYVLAKNEQVKQNQKVQSNLNESLAQYEAKNQGFLDRLDDSQVLFDPKLGQIIKQSANPAKVMDQLISDTALANKLNVMDPVSMMREVIALENREAPKDPAISSAPKPISTPSGSSVTPSISLADMTNAQYRDYMNNEKYKQG